MPLALRCRGCGAINPAGVRENASTGEQVPVRWTGPCPGCGRRYNIENWRPAVFGAQMATVDYDSAVSLRDVPDVELERVPTWIEGMDFILGGKEGARGIVPGSAILLCGPPGCGKSTLLMMAMFAVAKQHLSVLYSAGEQSLGELKTLANRIGKIPAAFKVIAKSHVDDIVEQAEQVKPAVLVIDSIQTVSATDPNGNECRPGTVAAIDIAGTALRNYCKANGIALVIIGQVTRDDEIAGPRRLEHLVDCCLFFDLDETTGERFLSSSKNRLGRAPLKTRFLMGDKGLIDCHKADKEAAAERAAAALAERITPAVSNEETFNPLSWTAPDGTTALTVLAVTCDEPDCRGTVDRACTASDGTREKGFHPSRIAKGKAHKRGASVLTLVRDEESTDSEDN